MTIDAYKLYDSFMQANSLENITLSLGLTIAKKLYKASDSLENLLTKTKQKT